MKKRDVILDFTSLLDVTLIIIFFFVLFSHFESVDNKAQIEARVNELDNAIQEAEQREAIADDMLEQLENELQIVRDADKRQASNIEEMIEYGKSGNIKLVLNMKSSGWGVRVIYKNEVVTEIQSNAAVGNELLKALQDIGYDIQATVLCDFIFDASMPGTASAYRKITEGLEEVKRTYKYLYFSETDLSIGEE